MNKIVTMSKKTLNQAEMEAKKTDLATIDVSKFYSKDACIEVNRNPQYGILNYFLLHDGREKITREKALDITRGNVN